MILYQISSRVQKSHVLSSSIDHRQIKYQFYDLIGVLVIYWLQNSVNHGQKSKQLINFFEKMRSGRKPHHSSDLTLIPRPFKYYTPRFGVVDLNLRDWTLRLRFGLYLNFDTPLHERRLAQPSKSERSPGRETRLSTRGQNERPSSFNKVVFETLAKLSSS